MGEKEEDMKKNERQESKKLQYRSRADILLRIRQETWSSHTSLALCVSLILYFSYLLSYMGWPPIGDVLIIHGPLVGLFEYQGRLPTDYYPINDATGSDFGRGYPLGFHALTAQFNTLFNAYPAEAVFAAGAFSLMMTIIAAFIFAYTSTKSVPLSILAAAIMFSIQPTSDLTRWLFGYFWNGPYPNLLGFALVFGYIALLPKENVELNVKFFAVSFLFILALVMAYPSFALFIVFFVALGIATSTAGMKKKIIVLGSYLATIGIILLAVQSQITSLLSDLDTTQVGYQIDTSRFYEFPLNIAIIPAFLVSIVRIMWWRSNFAIMYAVIATIVLAAALMTSSSLLASVLPNRSIVILSYLSWIVVLITAFDVVSHITKLKESQVLIQNLDRTLRSRTKISFSTPKVKAVLVVVIIASIAIPILSPYAGAEQSKWSWFSRSDSFQNDLNALKWLSERVEDDETILNDASFNSGYLLSLKPKHIIYHPLTASMLRFPEQNDIALELFNIWEDPEDAHKVAELLNRYNVSYVYTSSSPTYFSEPEIFGTSWQIVVRPRTPDHYVKVFDSYPFLEKVYEERSSAIYKVNQEKIDAFFETDTRKLPIDSMEVKVLGSWSAGVIGIPEVKLEDGKIFIEMTKGENQFWGIDILFPQHFDSNEIEFIDVSIATDRTVGITISILDDGGNDHSAINVLASDLRTITIPVDIDEGKTITGIRLVTGFVPPFPSIEDNITVSDVTVYESQ